MFDTNMKISPVEIGSPVSKRRWYLKQGSLWKDISETGLIGESGWGKQTLTDLHWKLKIGTICCCLERNTRLRRSRHWIEDEGGGGSWKYFLLIMNLLFCILVLVCFVTIFFEHNFVRTVSMAFLSCFISFF